MAMREADTTCYWYVISDVNVLYHAVKRFTILAVANDGGGWGVTKQVHIYPEVFVSLLY
jgi:hypothetical protein